MDKHKSLFLTTAFILIILFAGCQYFELLNNREWMKTSGNDEIDIYVTGADVINIGPDRYPCYWKNGQIIALEGGNDGYGEDIAIYNGDIYIAGLYGDGANFYACCWKNEKLTTLSGPVGVTQSWAQRLKIVEGNVYIGGYYTIGANYQACYWKNEKINILPNPGTENACIYDLEIVVNEFGETNIYAAGYYTIGVNQYACAWKNSEIIFADTTISTFTSLSIRYNTIYLAGNYDNQAAIWSNFGNRKILNTTTSLIYKISFNGSDIYHAGFYTGDTTAAYWENSIQQSLEVTGGTASQSRDIVFFDDDMYIAGFNNDEACYWKNGNRVDLPRTRDSAVATRILIVRRKY